MNVLERLTGLTSLNGCKKFQQILAGSIVELDLEGTEIALAIGRFLPRSASTITSLDLKYLNLFFLLQHVSISSQLISKVQSCQHVEKAKICLICD